MSTAIPYLHALLHGQGAVGKVSRGLVGILSGRAGTSSQGCLLACRMLEQQVKDLGQQVAVLVNQVHSLQSSTPPSRLRPSGTPSSSSGVVTADDIISERLVSFQDIQVGPCLIRDCPSFICQSSSCATTVPEEGLGACRGCSRGTWSS